METNEDLKKLFRELEVTISGLLARDDFDERFWLSYKAIGLVADIEEKVDELSGITKKGSHDGN